MTVFTIRLAELTIEMHSTYPSARDFCKDYLVENAVPDFSVEVTPEEIEREMKVSPEGATVEYAEIICLYRKIADRLPEYDRFVFHGAAISYNDNGYLFTAPSGTGKTTHISLWRKVIGERVGIINGDKPILRVTENGVFVYATPWAGKEGWYKNLNMPLKSVCLIEQSPTNSCTRIRPQEALIRLLQQIYIPKADSAAKQTLSLFEHFCRQCDFFVCKCDISAQAVKTSFEAMTGETLNIRNERHEN